MADRPRAFTVAATSYLRNLDHDELMEECIAIQYQKAPVRNESGSITHSLRFPLLLVTLYVEKPHEVAERIGAILERHWDAPASAADDREAALVAMLARCREQFLFYEQSHRKKGTAEADAKAAVNAAYAEDIRALIVIPPATEIEL